MKGALMFIIIIIISLSTLEAFSWEEWGKGKKWGRTLETLEPKVGGYASQRMLKLYNRTKKTAEKRLIKENITLDERVNEITSLGSGAEGPEDNETVIKAAETPQLPEKGVVNQAIHYEAAMTSPTELLAPEVFPDDITDMNGNATREKRNTKVDFHQGRSSNVRCLIFVLLLFIATTLLMAALFTWKMVESGDDSDETAEPEETRTCYERRKPARFQSTPKVISEYLKRMEEDIKTSLKESKQGVALANVVYYDEVIWEAKYMWDTKTKKVKKVNVEKLFPAASVTKVITALLAFILYNEKEIGLDDPIVKYYPDFWVRNPFDKDNGTKITIRQLITYVSGVPREGPCYPDNSNNYCPYNDSAILRKLRERTQLFFSPGTDALYGNLPFALAGNAISKNYPGGFTKLVQDKIFEPLEMTSSSFALNDTKKENMYPPTLVNGQIPKFKHWGWLDPAGGLLTTVHDLAKLEIALFNNSNSGFLRSAILDEFYTPAYIFANKQMLGSAWDIGFHKGYLNYSKQGYVYGYGSRIHIVPELRLAVNVLTTSDRVYEKLLPKTYGLVDLFHKELAKLPINKQRTPVSNPGRYIGDYYTNNVITLTNATIRISILQKKNGTHDYLLLTMGHYKFPLTYIGDSVFEMIHESPCKDFFLGINGERIHFTKPKNPEDKFNTFVIYGIHLRGKATFHRKQSSI